MLDIKWIKENAEYAKERLATRQKDFSAEIDKLLALDVERRTLIADTEAKKAYDIPADKGKLKAEKAEFIALHKSLAFLNRLSCGHARIIASYVVSHRISIRLNDAGNDEKQGPKKRIQENKKSCYDIRRKITAEAVKANAYVSKLNISS